ncbi:MAG: NAD-dependent epimerase/dehydratase family protein [Clostridia bacterium]|nr:NAD-dependent epimerase/dehydratase family protein [Clostridia bacterium]
MKCVVTGATGYIGNVLVRKLVQRGYEVTAFVFKGEDIDFLKDLDIQFKYGDVRDMKSLEDAFEGSEVVFHLAGIIEIGNGKKKLIHEVNVDGSKNVVNACKNVGVKKIVYTSSVHAIREHEGVIAESYDFNPDYVRGQYAKTKAEATKYILDSKTEEFEVIITHPSGVIGPYEYIPSNLGQLIIDCANKKIGAYLNGGYNFVDVRDVADGIIAAAEKGKSGECYILANKVVSVKELMEYIQDITKVKAPTFKIARWFAYATGFLSEIYYKLVKQKPLFTSYAVYTLGTNSNFSIEKAKKELGYLPRDIKDTLFDTIQWFKDRGKIKS